MTDEDDPLPPPEAPFPEEAETAPEAGGGDGPTAFPAEAVPDATAAAETAESAAPPAAAVSITGRTPAGPPPAARPDLVDHQEPIVRSCGGYRLRLEPADLARLRELPGARGKSDAELGESFFDGQAERLAHSVADDVPPGAELRVVVDPYSRQAFVALENRIRGILSF